MTQASILSGIYTDNAGDFRESYPVNLEPAVVESGISKGYLRSAPGIAPFGDLGPGSDRGGIVWQGQHVRVMGTRLVTYTAGGTITDRGYVGIGQAASFDYSFDRLGIASAGNLYYYDGTLTQVTDPDLGLVIDFIWIDGYFMTTDGVHLVVTELADPYAVNPLKYGSAEEDPDEITGLMKVRGEAYAVNRNTIENFQNRGGEGFPFVRNPGALIEKGCVGTKAKAYFADTFAFVGGGRNEAISVYLAGGGEALPISTPEIDRLLAQVSPDDYRFIECETRVENDEHRLLIHLPSGEVLVYHLKASLAAQKPVWTHLAGGSGADLAYPIKHLVYFGNRWIGGMDTGALGELDYSIATQFGEPVGWRFDTQFIYNASKGGILRTLELVGLTGRAPSGESPTVYGSWTLDGEVWSQERGISMGQRGQTAKRMQWRPGVRFSNFVGLRFRGVNQALASFARLEVEVEGLRV